MKSQAIPFRVGHELDSSAWVVHAKGPGVNKVQVNDETQVREIVQLRDEKVGHEIGKHRDESELR